MRGFGLFRGQQESASSFVDAPHGQERGAHPSGRSRISPEWIVSHSPTLAFPGTGRFPRTVIGIAIQRVVNSLLRKPDTTPSETYYWPEKP